MNPFAELLGCKGGGGGGERVGDVVLQLRVSFAQGQTDGGDGALGLKDGREGRGWEGRGYDHKEKGSKAFKLRWYRGQATCISLWLRRRDTA